MIVDQLLPRLKKVLETEENYELLRLFPRSDEHEVAWTRRTRIDRAGELQTTHLLVCECNFTEGIGWYIGSDKRYYEDPGGVRRCCSYRQLAIQHRYQELRHLCGITDKKLSMEHAERAMRVLLAVASENRMIGDEYESSYFSLQTFQNITKISDEKARATAERIYDTKTASYDGRYMVPYQEPAWLVNREETVTTKITANSSGDKLMAHIVLYTPAHSHMPPKLWYEVTYSDKQDPPITTHYWNRHLVDFVENALDQEQFDDKFEHFCRKLANTVSKVDQLQSF